MKMKFKKQKGFTLIELLIVVAIIGILVGVILVMIYSAKLKAKDASFKTTTNTLRAAMIMCCNKGGHINNFLANGNICNPADVNTRYPDTDHIDSGMTISDNCGPGDSNFQVTVTPGAKVQGNCTSAVLTQNGVTFNGCN